MTEVSEFLLVCVLETSDSVCSVFPLLLHELGSVGDLSLFLLNIQKSQPQHASCPWSVLWKWKSCRMSKSQEHRATSARRGRGLCCVHSLLRRPETQSGPDQTQKQAIYSKWELRSPSSRSFEPRTLRRGLKMYKYHFIFPNLYNLKRDIFS